MRIVEYPHPTLRHKSKPVRRVDAALRKTVREMMDLMYEAGGVGLAANQVDLPLRLFVANPRSDQDEEGREYVFINPVLSKAKGLDEAEEGCLSLPKLYGQVKRPKKVTIEAYNLAGELFRAELDGLFARVVQHETDHLGGVLFIDRLSETGKVAVKEALAEFESRHRDRRQLGETPADAAVLARLAELEAKYC